MVKKFKMILIIALVIAIVFVSGSYFGKKYDLFQLKTDSSSQISLVQDQLVELSELATLKYEYSSVIVSRLEQSVSVLGMADINYAETIKLIEYSGYLKAGTDLSKIKVSYDELSKKLLLKVSKSQILDNVVETEKTKVEDIKGNLFSDYPTQKVFDEINGNKKKLEGEKIAQGILDEADDRIRQLLTSFLKANGYKDIVIEFF